MDIQDKEPVVTTPVENTVAASAAGINSTSERMAIISVTAHGAKLGQRLRKHFLDTTNHTVECFEKEGRQSGDEATPFSSMKPHMETWFKTYDKLLFIMATGIVVRMIAPYIKHKSEDPAVVVMDEQGHFAISLLSGHLGGANEWTADIAQVIGATPVITTATDVNGIPAPDVLARKLQCKVEDFNALREVNSALVAGERVPYYIDDTLFFLHEYEAVAKEQGITLIRFNPHTVTGKSLCETGGENAPRVIITDLLLPVGPRTLVLRPPTMVVGVGCRRETPKELILAAITDSLNNVNRSPKSVVAAASVIVKSDEVGLLAAVEELQWPIHFFTQEEMAPFIEASHIEESNFVKQTIGVGNVCETTALLQAKSQTLLQKKTVYPRTTVAIAQVQSK